MTYETYAKIRDSVGLTDYKISQKTGISRTTLSSWKNGKYTPKQDKIEKIRDAIGEDVWDSSVFHQKEVNLFTGKPEHKLLHKYTYSIKEDEEVITSAAPKEEHFSNWVQINFDNKLDFEYKTKVEKILKNDKKRKLLMGLIDTLSED